MNQQTDSPHLIVTGATHPGVVRTQNEDHFFAAQAPVFSSPNGTPAYVAIVADGVGGSVGGEIASQLAVQTLVATLRHPSTPNIPDLLEEAIQRANAAIYAHAQGDPERAEMSTTVVMAVIAGEQLYVAHVGDSRAYLLRHGQIHLLTQDHSWLQEALLRQEIALEEIEDYAEHRSEITRWLGTPDPVEVDHTVLVTNPVTDSNVVQLQPGDTVLLCSDGLFDVVTDAAIAATISKQRTRPGRAANQLIAQANANGGPDNITVVLLHWVQKRRSFFWPLIFTALLVLCVSGIGLALRNWDDPAPSTGAISVMVPTATTTPSKTRLPTATWTVVATPSPEKPTTTPAPVAPATPTPLPTATPTPSPTVDVAGIVATSTAMTPSITLTDTPTIQILVTASATEAQPALPQAQLVSTTLPSIALTVTVTATTPITLTVLATSLRESDLVENEKEFQWEVNRRLQDDEFFELVIWKKGDDPQLHLGMVIVTAIKDTKTKVDLEPLDNQLKEDFEPGEFLWGIRLMPASRLLAVSSSPFNYQRKQ